MDENFGMEDARMEWKISGMEWKTIFHNTILDFDHGIYKEIYTDIDKTCRSVQQLIFYR